MNKIVLDKSFLRGVSGSKIKGLSQDNVFLMPYSLLYELVKDEPNQRAKLFRKFDEEKKYLLLPTFSELFQYEINHNKSISKPSDHINQRDFSLHAQLCDENYALSKEQLQTISQQKDDKEKLLVFFLKLVEEYIEKKKTSTKKELEDEIVFNKVKLTQNYAELQKFYKKTIDTSNFNPTWFIYKWLQVFNIFAIDTAYRYDSIGIIRESAKTKEKIIHDILDMEYLVMAVAEKSFGTKERKLEVWFKLLCPDGQLHN